MCKAFGSGGAQPVGTRVEPRRSVPPSTHGEPPLARTVHLGRPAIPRRPPRPVPSAGATSARVRWHGPGTCPGTTGAPGCPPHTPARAGHPRKPQAIAQRRTFRKAACPRSAPGRALMPRLPCKREGRTRARSLEATGQHTSIPRQPATCTGRRHAVLGTLTRHSTCSKVRVCVAVTRS